MKLIDFYKILEDGGKLSEIHLHKCINELTLCIYAKEFDQDCKDVLTKMKFSGFKKRFEEVYNSSWSMKKLPEGYKAYVFAYKMEDEHT